MHSANFCANPLRGAVSHSYNTLTMIKEKLPIIICLLSLGFAYYVLEHAPKPERLSTSPTQTAQEEVNGAGNRF